MPTNRKHQNKFSTSLTADQVSGVSTTPLNLIPTVAAPFTIALDASNLNGKYEVVEVSAKTATNINHPATLYAHTTAEEVRMVVGATELDEFAAVANGNINDTNGNEAIKIGTTASAVNEVTVTNAATAGIPQIAASGDDTNISLNLKGKGTGVPLNNGDPFINMVTSGAQAAFGTASTSFVDSTGATVTIVPTKAVRVHVTVSGRWYVNTGGESIAFKLLIDGVNIQEYDVKNAAANSGIPFCVSGQASLAAGSRVIKLQIRSAGGATVNADQANVNVIWG